MVAPGSHLTLDDVVCERLGEWRNRPGFTQAAADTAANLVNGFHAGVLGDAGIFFDGAIGGPAIYQPSLTSNRWASLSNSDWPTDVTRVPIVETAFASVGFAVAGNIAIAVYPPSVGNAQLAVFDIQTGSPVIQSTAVNPFVHLRCAATSTHLVAFLANFAGDLITYVVNASTGVVTGPTTIKTGLHLIEPYLDAIWYGGSTITVVARTAADAVRFIEYNPSTGALATDTTVAGVSCANCLSLLNDPTASGTRFVATSHTTPTTRVTRCSSAGAVLTNDQVEAVASTQITGVAAAAGADWSVVYQTAGGPRANYKASGVVGASALLRGANTDDLTIDSMGWGEDTYGYWHAVLGLHSSSTSDPQDSWIIASFPHGSNVASFTKNTVLVPGQASAPFLLSGLFQATRVAPLQFRLALPVLYQYQNNAGTVVKQYSIDMFTEKWLSSADIAAVNVGKCLKASATCFVPANGLAYVDGSALRCLGTSAPPRVPTLTQAAGGSLTLLGTYRFCVVIEKHDADGNIWRSPPSVDSSITLTGANATVGVAIPNWYSDETGVLYTVAVYRTSANGSLFRRIKSFNTAFNVDLSFNDTASDASIVDGALLYTPAELTTLITPPAAHVALFDDRMWVVNRDFRTELVCTKRLRPGRQPEFIAEGTIDIDDDKGDITGVVSIDGKGVVFKRNAIYFITGDGLEDDGSGRAHEAVQVSQDIGAIVGSPVVVAGDTAYFVSERGIYSIDRGANISFVGAGIDKYINQPLVQTPETVYDGCFVPAKNEVRFVTTNYILVWNITFQTWTRWTGLAGMKRCLVINGRMVLFKASDGTVWREGDHTQTTDQGAAIQGVIRSAWIRAAGDFGQFRLYRGLATAVRTAGGGSVSPTMQVFADDSDVQAQSWSPQAAIAGATVNVHMEARPQVQNMSSFSLQITLPAGDQSFRIDKFGAEVGIRGGGAQKRPDSERWA